MGRKVVIRLPFSQKVRLFCLTLKFLLQGEEFIKNLVENDVNNSKNDGYVKVLESLSHG